MSAHSSSSSLTALSPLDGRYNARVAALQPILSEYGYMRYRTQVEITWFIALSDLGLEGFSPFTQQERQYLLDIVENFSELDAKTIKDIEKITNHDVKAVEYWLTGYHHAGAHTPGKLDAMPSLAARRSFVHFACTSEDINNTSHALQLKAARQTVMLPMLTTITHTLRTLAHQYSGHSMLSRTHGQTASPTTVGKELANMVYRIEKCVKTIENIHIMAKMNGAVGNYNAHLAAYPHIDWVSFSKNLIESQSPSGLGLTFQPYSIQIEPHDYMAELFDAFARTHTVLIDVCRDIWGYISLGYFKQRLKEGEIGSSTMPHKVNPIDFENAEGNLGLSNALLKHLSEKLPISRWQRDLTDSTVLRNVGVALGYGLLAYHSLLTGLNKLQINEEALKHDLDNAWEVLAEPIQTVMRAHGLEGAYEKLKALTRGKRIEKEDLHALIQTLDIGADDKRRLLTLTPHTYTGLAQALAQEV